MLAGVFIVKERRESMVGPFKVIAISGVGIAAISGLTWALKHFLGLRGYDDLDSTTLISLLATNGS